LTVKRAVAEIAAALFVWDAFNIYLPKSEKAVEFVFFACKIRRQTVC
jgi:hypothetical protein